MCCHDWQKALVAADFAIIPRWVTVKAGESFNSADDTEHVIRVEFEEQEPSNVSDAH